MKSVTMGEPPVGAREGLPPETDPATDAGARRERALRKVGAGADPAWLDQAFKKGLEVASRGLAFIVARGGGPRMTPTAWRLISRPADGDRTPNDAAGPLESGSNG